MKKQSRERGVKSGLGDGFVGTGGREGRGDDRAHEHQSAQDNERRQDSGAAVTREDVLRMLREDNLNNALPPCPPMPGWHVCWVSTTNKNDTPEMRERMGYVPVEHAEVRGFDSSKIHSGELAGRVVCNEMILYKVPEDVYQAIMKFYHHDKPNEEGASILSKVDEMKDAVGEDSGGKHLVHEEGEGFGRIREANRRAARTFE